MRIEVALVEADGCRLETVELPAGASVADALAASALATERGGGAAPTEGTAMAIFGEIVRPERMLREGDRVDLLPPLPVDPMTARRQRSERGS